jgi:WD40 repeat protein
VDTQDLHVITEIATGHILSRAASCTPDGALLATAGQDGQAKIWSAVDGSLRQVLKGHSGQVLVARFSPDGKYVATGGADSSVMVWLAEGGRHVGTYTQHHKGVRDIAFRPDGRSVASCGGSSVNHHTDQAGEDLAIRIWDPDTFTTTSVCRGHEDEVEGVAFSSDGQRLLSWSRDGTARTWDASTGDCLGVCGGHRGILKWTTTTVGAVTRAVFSPNRRLVATSSYDGNVRVWLAETGQLLATLAGHQSWVYGVAFSGDGSRIVSASRDRTARVWRATACE